MAITKKCLIWGIFLIVNIASAAKPFSIENASIDSITQAIKTQQITCQHLILQYLTRIQQHNLDLSRGAAINAFTSINPAVLATAKRLDQYFKSTGQLKGPLHCVPIVVKDNMDTYDMPATSGSLALLGTQPLRDAFLVAQLRQAGGIIIGKANMDEFASGMIGISSRVGRTGNAYDPKQNPAGSSGGTAAAVSANFAVIGIGSDNSGSIRVPAAFNGVYGLRPSRGLVSQHGVFPRGNLDGVSGPLTRSVKDMAIVLTLIAQPDPQDKLTLEHPVVKSYAARLTRQSLRGLKFGIVRSGAHLSPFKQMPKPIVKMYQGFFKRLENNGATLTDVRLPRFDINRKDNMSGEIEEMDQYLANFPATRKNFKDICQSERTTTFGDKEACLRHLSKTASLKSREYQDVLKRFIKNRQYILSIMKKHNLDALLMPIARRGPATYDIFTVNTWKIPLSSNSGLPGMVVNVGYTDDQQMPVGVEMIGKFYDETTLLQIAHVIDKNISRLQAPPLKQKQKPPKMMDISAYNNFLTMLGYNTYYSLLLKTRMEDLKLEQFNKILRKTKADMSRQQGVT